MAQKAPTTGERDNAMRILERGCKEHGITVADALAGRFGIADFGDFEIRFTNAAYASGFGGFYWSGNSNMGNAQQQAEKNRTMAEMQYKRAKKDVARAQAKVDELKKKYGFL